jgi:hypothetical protein|tara:strand:+ start:1091 stop:1312 length:222 start_codon:yes stop_codon:yes gene_type:complete
MKTKMNQLFEKLDGLKQKLDNSNKGSIMPNGNWCHPETYTEKEYEADCSLAVNSYIKDLCKEGLEKHKGNTSC